MAKNLKLIVENFKAENLPIKLHLGCGPNILEGYINVEGEYMKDHPEIALHDLTEILPISNDTIDEILSVHVIEHIMPHDVPLMLQDWLRVLRPGGKVAIEWPDLYKMCKFLVEDPSRFYSKNSKILKRGVAGIFGNIERYRDIAMLHKWGYSADSLKILLTENGFVNVSVEKNIYPKTEMCSRIVGFK